MSPSSGIVTFLFTDIEGSTGHWERRPDLMRPALVRHNEIIRDAVSHPLVAARRKAVTLRFARTAAALLHALADPDAVPDGRL